MNRADQIERAIIAESARWGDAREGERGERGVIVPTMTVDHWRAERDNVRDNYMPRSHQLAIERFRADGLYPATAAPVFNQHGGVVTRSFGIELSAVQGDVYHTTDGSDPRLPGGEVSSQATRFQQPLKITGDSVIKARVLHDGQWSPLVEADFVLASDVPLRITEVNYNPHDANLLGGMDELDAGNDRFEFIELTNVGEQPIPLGGVRLEQRNVGYDEQGIDFVFSAQTLDAGQSVVVARDREAFRSRYGSDVRLATGDDGDASGEGTYGGRLSNNGEQITLVAANGQIIQQFAYGVTAPWPDRSNGKGSSLQVVDVTASYRDPMNWRSSVEFGGSPGRFQTGPPPSSVVLNEILVGAGSADADQVELRNLADHEVDVSGWFLSDSDDDYFKVQIPSATVIPGGGLLVLDQAPLGFDLDGVDSDDVWLVAADSTGRPAFFADYVQFPPTAKGISVGPWPTANDAWIALASPTLGRANSGPWIGDIVFSEVHYHPVDPDGDRILNADDFEFIELYNRSGQPVDISGWELSGSASLVFSERTVIGPDESLIVLSTDASDYRETDVFRFVFDMGSRPASFAGPYRPVLNDDAGLLQLRRPRETSATGSNAEPWIVVDQLMYESTAPWPGSPGGSGDSLARISPDSYGNLPSGWTAASPSPGLVDMVVRVPGDANEDGLFDRLDLVTVLQAGKYLTGQPADWSEGDWTGDGLFDQQDIMAALGGAL
jgi:hypothetical protein